jgi:hypothetical protein
MNGYDLSRNFVNFSFENPSKIKPNHYALYFFAIEHCNRLGWKKEYGLPTTMTMEAIGIKSYNTYIKTFNELVDFGFFNLVERSKNQYSANIIELSNNDKAPIKALDKAFIKHATKQVQSTEQSISSINKPITSKPITTLCIEDLPIFEPPKPQVNIITEEVFLKRWCDARTYYDKLPTNIKRLTSFEKIDFADLKRDYELLEFEQAMKGFFQQKTFLKTRLRPSHFLKREHFETYLTCFTTNEKLFEDKGYKKQLERL